MKILITVSAVVFLMILTTGLATAKKVPVPTFPFTATGDTFRVMLTGNVLGVLRRTSLFTKQMVFSMGPSTSAQLRLHSRLSWIVQGSTP